MLSHFMETILSHLILNSGIVDPLKNNPLYNLKMFFGLAVSVVARTVLSEPIFFARTLNLSQPTFVR